MPRSLCLPTICDEAQVRSDTEAAREEFRERRLAEPLADYLKAYPTAKEAADVVVSALSAIVTIPTDKAVVAHLVGNKAQYAALRSLAATPISEDDLQTLVRAKVNKTALNSSQTLADAVAKLFKDCLDPNRFPWVDAGRAATAIELEKAKLATSVLNAVSAVQAARRGDERKALEGKVQEILEAAGYSGVRKCKGGIKSNADFPHRGKFMMSCTLGAHNADFVIRLFDGRLMVIECKASNSEVNGFKRLNKEVVVDAGDWVTEFGKSVVVPAAALRGVFKQASVAAAQNKGVHLFWWHRIDAFAEFLAAVTSGAKGAAKK